MTDKIRAAGTKRKPRPKAIKRKPGAGVFASPSAERDAAIERIVKATGNEPDSRDLLAKGIDETDIVLAKIFFWKEASSCNVGRIRKALEDAVRAIESDPILERFFDAPELNRMLGYAKSLATWQRMRRREKGIRHQKNERRPAPIDWLAAELRQVYEMRFSSPATWSWRGEEAQGTLIDFIEAAPCRRSC